MSEILNRTLKKHYDNMKQDCSLFFDYSEIAATLSAEYKGKHYDIDLVASTEFDIRERSNGERLYARELREMFGSTEELYEELEKEEDSSLEEIYSNRFAIFINGEEYADEVLYEVEELESWSDRNIIYILDDFIEKQERNEKQEHIKLLLDEDLKKFVVKVEEVIVREIPVYAENYEEAKAKVFERYRIDDVPKNLGSRRRRLEIK